MVDSLFFRLEERMGVAFTYTRIRAKVPGSHKTRLLGRACFGLILFPTLYIFELCPLVNLCDLKNNGWLHACLEQFRTLTSQ